MEKFNLHELAKPLRDKVRPIITAEVETAIQEHGVEGVYQAAHRYLEKVNVRPVFTKETEPQFNEWRERLQQDKGVLISNHPSSLDAFLLMEALKRTDIKIVVNKTLYEQTQDMALNDLFIPATHADDPLSMRKQMMVSIKAHLDAGGLLVIFPTGGRELEQHKIEFEPGLGHILGMLDDNDMVYSFHIDTESLKPVSNILKVNSSVLADFYLPEELNPANMRDTHDIYVDEQCQNASQWKHILAQHPKQEASEALTSYYLNLFDIPPTELSKLQTK